MNEELPEISIKPVRGHIAVKGVPLNDRPAGSRIIVPETTGMARKNRSKCFRGTVLRVGEECHLGIKRGDDVLFGRYVSTQVTVDELDVLIMKETDVLGVIDK